MAKTKPSGLLKVGKNNKKTLLILAAVAAAVGIYVVFGASAATVKVIASPSFESGVTKRWNHDFKGTRTGQWWEMNNADTDFRNDWDGSEGVQYRFDPTSYTALQADAQAKKGEKVAAFSFSPNNPPIFGSDGKEVGDWVELFQIVPINSKCEYAVSADYKSAPSSVNYTAANLAIVFDSTIENYWHKGIRPWGDQTEWGGFSDSNTLGQTGWQTLSSGFTKPDPGEKFAIITLATHAGKGETAQWDNVVLSENNCQGSKKPTPKTPRNVRYPRDYSSHLKVTSKTSTSLTFSWVAPPDFTAVKYELYRYNPLAESAGWQLAATSKDKKVTDSKLQPGRTYHYQICGYDSKNKRKCGGTGIAKTKR